MMTLAKQNGVQPSNRSKGTVLIALAVAILALLGLSVQAQAQTETVLYSFTGSSDGAGPNALISDGAGNFYGTTVNGGSFSGACSFGGCGVVFELAPNGSGGWTENVLYAFQGGADGHSSSAPLVRDAAGNLYGTSLGGGLLTNTTCNETGFQGCGVVFELSPNGSGWTETVLYTFQGGLDGFYPYAGLTMDAAGNLYGTTELGGPTTKCPFGCGEVYKLTPNGTGGYNYAVIHQFTDGKDGSRPYTKATLDAAGNVYVAASQGGNTNCGDGCGTLVELSPNGTGGYKTIVLYGFKGSFNGWAPTGDQTFDAAGNLYGSAQLGGREFGNCKGLNGCGFVFKLTPKTGGGWGGRAIYEFSNNGDGYGPSSPFTPDASGNLYGTVGGGNSSCLDGCGYVVELSPSANGSYTETTLYSFTGLTDGGDAFNNGVLVDSSGNLFGATQGYGIAGGCSGFANGCGVIYEITRP